MAFPCDVAMETVGNMVVIVECALLKCVPVVAGLAWEPLERQPLAALCGSDTV